ncbi:HK97 family prophage LambdaSa04 [Neorhizobium galegae bv. officinalis bv. officinalis str. HAMBI 1141]|uniref:HK97 family prophage LambdaSa04 n=1 Tax=Neorhizobium galegae bv. officinalis bv. officinalis str. HAMBI 1141 TaxID=1028801 RepID=A0A068T2A8_NEOGA|nr:phage major capsid protein [Neorhizobium galegae]CDN52528.1 HK97 family prophage LambdaSa04 [Neorhizobium galegae bv. officinalis bv. officinalis str. HAMBI 1141]
MTKHLTVPASVAALLALHIPSNFFLYAEDPTIAAHRERQMELMNSSQAILARAESESRDLTQAETDEVEGLTNEFETLESQINLRERVAQQNALLTAPRARQTDPDPVGNEQNPSDNVRGINNQARTPAPRVPAAPRATAGGNSGFRHLGEFANSVRMASMRSGGDLDPRLRNAAVSTYGNEGSGADGGFAVPPDFRTEILSPVFNEDSLLAMTDRLQSSSNTLTLPTDSTTPWQTSGGIQSYWTAEGGTKTQSKPTLGETTLKLHTLATLIPVTEELLEDAPAMGAYLNRKAPEKMDFKVSDAIVRGTGVGMPLGFMNSPALVTVAAEAAQTADTIVVANLAKMWGRLPVQSRRTAVWLMHPDAEAQLPLMTLANQPVYLPPGGVSGNMYGSLWGRPVIPHQVAETVGDLGDVMLVDLKQYLSVTKTGNGRDANGLKSDVSIHLWFDQDMVAFRFTMRVAGQPWWPAAITQRDGANSQSPYVALAAR